MWGFARAQSRTLTGVVKDSKSNEVMPGVNVILKGTSSGTITDANGEFSLTVNSDNDILIFSFVGYKKVELPVGTNTILQVGLETDAATLEEVVVVGYGEQKKSNVTGAISSVKAQDLQDLPNPRVEDALKGRTSGVMITSSSGQPGSSPSIYIRGVTSINDSSPLIVVDGVPISGGFDYLNSGDIESIEVLKDAASAAIYGTKAASGVILVTTKKGKAGALRVNISSYFGTQGPARKMNLLNATEYATLRNESMLADGVINNPSGVAGSTKYFANPAALGAGTDWQGQIFNNNAYIQNSELGISGGTDKSTYFASVGYFKQEGIVATSISNYKRVSVRLNSTHKINNWLRFGQTFSYAYTKSMGGFDPNGYYGGVLGSAINLDPTTPVVETNPNVFNDPSGIYPQGSDAALLIRDAHGNPYGISPLVGQEMVNPSAYIRTQQGNYGWGDKIVGNGYLEVEPIKGLKLRTTAGVDMGFWGGDSYRPYYYLSATSVNRTANTFSRNMNKGLNWVWTNTVSYTRSFNEHNVSVMIGTEARTLNQAFGVNGTLGTTSGISQASSFGTASMNWTTPPTNTQGGGYESQDYKISSIFARATWDYQGKYMVTGVIRRDGSSNFGANRHYGIFPSLSAGWTPSLESFWPQNNVVNNLKLRIGYGVNGNDNLGPFKYTSVLLGGYYPFGGSTLSGATFPYAIANPNLGWEQTMQLNYAFDAQLLNTLSLSVDVFTKKTTGMLMQVNPPAIVGAENAPWQNIGAMQNHGVEITLGYQKQIGQVGLDLKGNLTLVQNKVTNLGDNPFLKYGSIQSSAYEISRKTVGQPVNEFYGFKRLGLFQTQQQIDTHVNKDGQLLQPNAKPGDVIWADVNGDGKIDDNDRIFLGNPTPTSMFGFTIGVTYKNFDLKIFAQGVAGNKIYRGFRRLDIPTANYQKNALARWTGAGTSNWYPRMTDADPNGNLSRPSSFYLDDGSYLRVKTIQLGYNFPKSLLSKAAIQNARVYIGVNNLLTFTHYSGYDPEIGGGLFGQDHGIYPQARSYMVGFNMTF
jgi:TonB-linked SusC/RagA family outer membrane protein